MGEGGQEKLDASHSYGSKGYNGHVRKVHDYYNDSTRDLKT